MTEEDRKLLTGACGLCWHDLWDKDGYRRLACPICGKQANKIDNPDFTTADDWELVRVKVAHKYLNDCIDYIDKRVSITDPPELLCQAVCNWIKSSPDLFPWVAEMMEKGRE